MAQRLEFQTEQGVAAYPYITTPDFGYDVEGIYKTKIKMPEADATKLMQTITEVAQQEFGAKAKTARMPFKKLDDTGEVEFTTKSKFKPKVFNGAGQIIEEAKVPRIYGGSTIKVKGTLYPYNAGGNIGVSLQLAGVQLIKLSEGSGSAISFEAVEGGYVEADNDNAAPETNGASYNF